MKQNIVGQFVWTVGALVLVACQTDEGPVVRPPLRLQSALLAAPNVVADAFAGRLERGEQDFLVKLEKQLPGFGGLRLTDRGIEVFMKPSAVPANAIRNALANAYAGHSNALVRQALSGVRTAAVLPGAYSLSELIAIEQRISGSPVAMPGWTGVGTDIANNRVAVMFEDSTALLHGLSVINSIAVPSDALEPLIMPPVQLEADWTNKWRPTGGGLELYVGNNTAMPGYWKNNLYQYDGQYFSLGYNVTTPSGVDYLLTAAHPESIWRGINGVIGDTLWQPNRSVGPIATITNNARYKEGAECPFDALHQRNYDFCTIADVMLGTYFAGVAHDRKVGTSVRGGVIGDLFGGIGSQQVNGFYSINAVLPPEYVRDTLHHDLAKSGMWTGTTSGRILVPMGDFPFPICFPSYAGCTQSYNMLLQKHGSFYAQNGAGDSGAPVFTGNPNNGAPYAAVGIHIAGTNASCFNNPNPTNCYIVFSRWDMIEQRLSMTIRPQTTLP